MNNFPLILGFTVFLCLSSAHDSNGTDCVVPKKISYLTPCYCDPVCTLYGDCCHRLDTTTPFVTCTDIKSISLPASSKSMTWAFVFDKCPPRSRLHLKTLCEMPVSSSDGLDRQALILGNDSRLFRNVYCAMCHGADFRFPDIHLHCDNEIANFSKDEPVLNWHNTTQCRLAVDTKREEHQCFPKLKSQCPPMNQTGGVTQNETIRMKCQTDPTHYIVCIHKPYNHYRNPSCAACFDPDCKPQRNIWRSKPIPIRYSILLDFKRLIQSAQPQAADSPHNASLPRNASHQNTTTVAPHAASLLLSYLTLTSCLLSAIGLALLILTYAALPALRNFGGLLTTSLASSLLLGLLGFILGLYIPRHTLACRIVAVLTYFAYFASFAWMSLFAAHLLNTFASPPAAANAARDSSTGTRYAKAALVGWILPILIATAALTVDVVWPLSIVSPSFGTRQCYFNRGYALLAWFYVPVAFAVLANTAICLAVIALVSRTAKQTRQARTNSATKQILLISLKITAIFGVTWILGITASLIDSDLFKDIAAIVNSLHGAFIASAFLLTPRTVRAIRARATGASSSDNRATASSDARSIEAS